MLHELKINYTEFVSKELMCAFEETCEGNPLGINFDPLFLSVYKEFGNKYGFIMMITNEVDAGDEWSDALLCVGNKIIDIHDENAECSKFSLTSELLWAAYHYSNPKIVDYVGRILNVVTEDWYLRDIGMISEMVLLKMDSGKASKEIVMANLNHPIAHIAACMQDVLKTYKERGIID
jgi:hypothetical protein